MGSGDAQRYVPVRPALRRTAAEALAFLRPNAALTVDPALPRGSGQPVLVLPVIGRGDDHAAPMRAALDQLGYRAFGWGLGTNIGPSSRVLAGIEDRLSMLHAAHGPINVVGFSLGGIFARRLAHRQPEKVRQVITVCSPFREAVHSAFLPLQPVLWAWRTPNLLAVAAAVEQRLPVPGTFIFSRNDGIVAWESCLEPEQPGDCAEISGLHVTIVRDPEVLAILAHRLGRER